jgi:hypothetical protein
MVRTSLRFKAYGSTEADIRRRAISQTNEFLDLPIDATPNNYDMDIDVEEVVDAKEPTYVGTVFVKIKH